MVAACLVLAAAILPSCQTTDAVTHQHLPVERDKDPDSGPAVLGQVVPASVGLDPAQQDHPASGRCAKCWAALRKRLKYWHPLEEQNKGSGICRAGLARGHLQG